MNDIRRTILWVIFGFSMVLLWDQWQVHNGKPATFFPQRASHGRDGHGARRRPPACRRRPPAARQRRRAAAPSRRVRRPPPAPRRPRRASASRSAPTCCA